MKRAPYLLLLLPVLLTGCKTLGDGGSVAGSCAVFERPPYAVKGKTSYDQNVADNFVESGVAGCNWKRPVARPASIDAPIKRGASPAPPPMKRGFIKRIKDRVVHPFAKPVAQIVESPAPAPLPAPVAPPPPRDPVDELLHPNGGK